MAETKTLNYIIKFTPQNWDQAKRLLDGTKVQYKQMDTATKGLTQSSQGLARGMASIASRALLTIPVWFVLRNATMGLIRGFGALRDTLFQVETAMADIRIVGKMTEIELDSLKETVLGLSVAYGVAAQEALGAARIFAQQGLGLKDIVNMTRAAMMGSQLLGANVKEVAENLTAAIRAYGYETNEAMKIVDRWMAVQKNFAVTSKDLANATKTAGAAASAFGIDYEKFLGHVTSIIEVTRRSGQQAGNALQMIYSRLFTTGRRAIQEIARVPVFLKEGMPTFEDTGVYREAGEVMDDLAIAFQKLSDAQKIQLAALVGSRRQIGPFIAMMDNYNRSLEAQIVAYASAGDAYNSWLIKQETAEIKVKQMQNSWAQLVTIIGNTDPWKLATDVIGDLAKGLAYLVNWSKATANAYRGQREEMLMFSEAQLSEAEGILKLIKLRDTYNKKLQESTTPEQKKSVENILALIDKSIGGRSASEGLIDILTEKVIEDRVALEIDPRIKELEILIKDFNRKEAGRHSLFGDSVPSPFLLPAHTDEQVLVNKQNKKELDELKQKRQELIDQKTAEAKLEKERAKEIDYEAIAEKEVETAKKLLGIYDHQAKLLKIRGIEEKQVLQWQLAQLEANEAIKESDEGRVKILALQRQLVEEIANEIMEYSNTLKSSIQGAMQDIFAGEATLQDFGKRISDTISKGFQESLAEGLTGSIMSSGIGDIFGGSMVGVKGLFSGLQQNIEQAHQTVYMQIVRAHRDGASMLSATAGWTGSGATGGGYGGGIPINQMYAPGQQATTYGPGNVPTGISGSQAARRATGGGAMWGGLGMSALMGYSSYQSASAGGAGRGRAIGAGVLSGVGYGALALGMGVGAGVLGGTAFGAGVAGVAGSAGALSGMGAAMPMLAAIPVWGWIAIGVAAIVGSMLLSNKKFKQTDVQEQVRENQVSSRINVTNKNLEIINRNLVALRTDIRQYILPASAYFSEKSGLEDNFSIMSRRGFLG